MKQKLIVWIFLLVVSFIFIAYAVVFVFDGYRTGQPNVGWSCAAMFFLMIIVIWAKLINEDKRILFKDSNTAEK